MLARQREVGGGEGVGKLRQHHYCLPYNLLLVSVVVSACTLPMLQVLFRVIRKERKSLFSDIKLRMWYIIVTEGINYAELSDEQRAELLRLAGCADPQDRHIDCSDDFHNK